MSTSGGSATVNQAELRRMDTELLVENQIDDGRRLVEQAVSDGMEVSAAFWVKTSEEGLWHLYIASPLVNEVRLGEAYRQVYASLGKILESSVSPSDITLVNDRNPIARDIIAVRDRSPARVATRYGGKRIGSVSIVEAYIYPPLANSMVGPPASKHGARVYLLEDGVALVKQTAKRTLGQKERYVIDAKRETHVDPGDDAALGAAVRAALEGRL
jgi:hypothetical protein